MPDPGGIRLPGQPLLEHEAEDPYDNVEIPTELTPLYSWKFSDSFVPDRRYAEGSRRYTCLVRVPAEDYVRFFRTNDGSPVVLTSFFLKETIRRPFPIRSGRHCWARTTITTSSCPCSSAMTNGRTPCRC